VNSEGLGEPGARAPVTASAPSALTGTVRGPHRSAPRPGPATPGAIAGRRRSRTPVPRGPAVPAGTWRDRDHLAAAGLM